MMTCRELAEMLIDFVSGEMPPECRLRCEEHLRRCQNCDVYVQTYRVTICLSKQLPKQTLPPEVVDRLKASLKHLLATTDDSRRHETS